MVQLSNVYYENSNVTDDAPRNQVAVFVGATAGIGEGTLDVFAGLLESPCLYVVGRSTQRFETQHKRLQQNNPNARIVFVEADISRLAGVDTACKQIVAAESQVDYLYMSPGYLPLAGAVATPDGTELCFQLSYYARIRFLYLLEPLLSAAPRPRVLSVLNGGKEGRLIEDDLALDRTWSVSNLMNHTTTMSTLALDRFAAHHPNWTLVHAAPGLVRTDIARKAQTAADASLWWRLVFPAIRQLTILVFAVQGITIEESGARNANLLVTNRLNHGVWRIDQFGDVAPSSDLLDGYRREGWAEKTWDFTMDVWRRALGDAAWVGDSQA